MTGNVEVIGPTSVVPIRVLVTDIVDVISDKVPYPSHPNPRVMPQPCNGERHEEEIGPRGIFRDEVAVQEDLLEVTLARIVATRFKIHRCKHIPERIIPPVRVDIYLKAPIHLFIVFKEGVSIMEHIRIIPAAS